MKTGYAGGLSASEGGCGCSGPCTDFHVSMAVLPLHLYGGYSGLCVWFGIGPGSDSSHLGRDAELWTLFLAGWKLFTKNHSLVRCWFGAPASSYMNSQELLRMKFFEFMKHVVVQGPCTWLILVY